VNHIEGSNLLGRNNEAECNDGIIFPYIWPGDSKIETYRLRWDKPPRKLSKDGRWKDEAKYVSEKNKAGIIYFAPSVKYEWLWDSGLPVVVIEGEKKALAVQRAADEHPVNGRPRLVVVGLPGVWNWRMKQIVKDEDGEERTISVPIPALDKIKWEGRRVTILFDSNASTNENVSKARERLARELFKVRGAEVRIANLPALPGVNGADDFLALHGPQRLLAEILESARIWTPPNREIDSDADNARRLIKLHGENIRFVGDLQQWVAWAKKRWEIGNEAYSFVFRKAQETAKFVNFPLDKKIKGRRGAENMLKVAEHDPTIRIPRVSDFDSDPALLNVENGTINLLSGELRQHDRRDLLSKLAPVKYDPNATCPRFLTFLREIFGPHPDIIPFIQRALGYSATGLVKEHVVFFLHGAGRNGKGTLISILNYILGAEYAHTANIATFMATNDSGRGPNEGLANLLGQRLVSAQEPNEGRTYDIALLKHLSGGDEISTHRKYGHQFTFLPSHKLFIATNPPPRIPPGDQAIWARLRLIPFAVSFEHREDTGLLDTLKTEASGILNWLIEGAREWHKHGLGSCPSVEAATAHLRETSDLVGQFIDDRCDVGADLSDAPADLYEEYKDWNRENGHKQLSHNKFAARLESLGYRKATVHGHGRRKGLRLKRKGLPPASRPPLRSRTAQMTPPTQLIMTSVLQGEHPG
jgi:putative DNA primase/helicase